MNHDLPCLALRFVHRDVLDRLDADPAAMSSVRADHDVIAKLSASRHRENPGRDFLRRELSSLAAHVSRGHAQEIAMMSM